MISEGMVLEKISPERRKEIAKNAAEKPWPAKA